jgi:hypothetical protein
MSEDRASKGERRLVVRAGNRSGRSLHVRIEPWGREYDLSADAMREFVFTGPADSAVDVEVGADELTVFGWAGSVLDGIGLPVPALPPGQPPETNRHPSAGDVRSAIEGAVSVLVGTPLWWDQRVVDMQVFGFGARMPGRGVNREVPELFLHIQCRWRVINRDGIVVGSADIFWPPEESAVSYDDFDYDGKRSRRDELVDSFMLHGEDAHVVTRTEGRHTGDVLISFLDGCGLEIWSDHRSGREADGPNELWRFIARDDPHFVVTPTGIQT